MYAQSTQVTKLNTCSKSIFITVSNVKYPKQKQSTQGTQRFQEKSKTKYIWVFATIDKVFAGTLF